MGDPAPARPREGRARRDPGRRVRWRRPAAARRALRRGAAGLLDNRTARTPTTYPRATVDVTSCRSSASPAVAGAIVAPRRVRDDLDAAVPRVRRAACDGSASPRVTAYFDEHVEADAVHENLAARRPRRRARRGRAALVDDILFGASACLTWTVGSGAACVPHSSAASRRCGCRCRLPGRPAVRHPSEAPRLRVPGRTAHRARPDRTRRRARRPVEQEATPWRCAAAKPRRPAICNVIACGLRGRRRTAGQHYRRRAGGRAGRGYRVEQPARPGQPLADRPRAWRGTGAGGDGDGNAVLQRGAVPDPDRRATLTASAEVLESGWAPLSNTVMCGKRLNAWKTMPRRPDRRRFDGRVGDHLAVDADGSQRAHSEHTVAVTDGDPVVLTARD